LAQGAVGTLWHHNDSEAISWMAVAGAFAAQGALDALFPELMLRLSDWIEGTIIATPLEKPWQRHGVRAEAMGLSTVSSVALWLLVVMLGNTGLRRAIAGICLLTAVYVAVLCIVVGMVDWKATPEIMALARSLVALMCVIAALLAAKVVPNNVVTTASPGAIALAYDISAVVLCVTWVAWTAVPNALPRSLVFLESEGAQWDVPEYGRYGAYSQGMFGLLPSVVTRMGVPVLNFEDLDTSVDLASPGPGIVVAINGIGARDEDVVRLRTLVEEGWTALLFCDHTDVFGQMAPINDFLSGSGIRLKFDSAYPEIEGTLIRATRCRFFGPPRWGALRLGAPITGIGASLACDAPARLLAWTDNAFSDQGERSNVPGAFLGNYSRDLGESIGRTVLIAESRLGSGRVIVLGDTTIIQNATLSQGRSGGVEEIIAYAAPEYSAWVSAGKCARWIVPVIGFVGLVAAIGARRRFVRIEDCRPLLTLTCALGAIGAASWGPESTSNVVTPDNVCVPSDVVHESRVEGASGSSFGSLYMCCVRAGYWPNRSATGTWGAGVPGLIVLCDPMGDLTLSVERSILDAVERGSALIALLSPRASSTCPNICAALGVEVYGAPVKAATGTQDFKHGVLYRLEASEADIEIVAAGERIGIGRRYGEGNCIVIADPYIFGSFAAEGLTNAVPGNIELARRAIEAVRDGFTGDIYVDASSMESKR
jgi:hypothetical protein